MCLFQHCLPLHPDTQRSSSSPRSGDRCVAKWSQSSCTTEVTAGTAITASPVPAVTRSCWMEPASSWTSTPQRTTTCWMAMLPHRVGCLTLPTCLLLWPRTFSEGDFAGVGWCLAFCFHVIFHPCCPSLLWPAADKTEQRPEEMWEGVWRSQRLSKYDQRVFISVVWYSLGCFLYKTHLQQACSREIHS